MTKKNKKIKGLGLGNIFDAQLLYRNITFLVFLTLIGIFYISNSHRAEKKVRKIQQLQSEIKKSEWKYWESKSDVQWEGVQSQTEKRVQDLGLKAGEGSIKILKEDPKPEDIN